MLTSLATLTEGQHVKQFLLAESGMSSMAGWRLSSGITDELICSIVHHSTLIMHGAGGTNSGGQPS